MQQREKIFVNHQFHKSSISRLYKGVLKLNKKAIQFKKWAQDSKGNDK